VQQRRSREGLASVEGATLERTRVVPTGEGRTTVAYSIGAHHV